MTEIHYDKYRRRGDYHWRQISHNPFEMSAYVLARYQTCIDLYEKHGGRLAGKRILDHGCGDGAFSWLLERSGAEVIGIDPAHEAIVLGRAQHQRRHSTALLCTASGYATPFRDAFFDGVISTDVIEHVQDPHRFLGEIHRLLKPKGWMVISTPIRLTERPLDRLHVIEWFPSDFKALVATFFPRVYWFCSHPVFWGEMSRRSKLLRVLTNIFSFHANPFRQTRKWGLYELQYVVCQKD